MTTAWLLGLLGCGGGGDDLRSKSWTLLDPSPGQGQGAGMLFDEQGRLVAHNLDRHIYRFDPATRLWSDLGEQPMSPDAWFFKIFADPTGGFYGYSRVDNEVLHWIRQVPGDELLWEPLADLASNQGIQIAAGVVWQFDGSNAGNGRITMTRLDTGVTAEADGFSFDAQGHPILTRIDGAATRVGSMGADGQIERTLYTCDGVLLTLLCQSGGGNFFTRDDGTVVWSSYNDALGSQMYRLRPGEVEAEPYAEFPVAYDDNTYNHTINLAYDRAGNAFITRTDNNFGTESMFYLPVDGDAWEWVIDTPGLVDVVLVSPLDDTIFVLDGSDGLGLHILE